jgi:hypothetical protein
VRNGPSSGRSSSRGRSWSAPRWTRVCRCSTSSSTVARWTVPAVRHLLRDVPEGLDPWVLPAGTLDRVGDATTSQGVLATVERVDSRVALTRPHRPGGGPGRVGRSRQRRAPCMRAAAAAGAGAVVIAGGVDPTSPKVVRSSAGARVRHRPRDGPGIRRGRSSRLRRAGLPHRGHHGGGGRRALRHASISPVRWRSCWATRPTVPATPRWWRAPSLVVTMPMAGPTESLNVAMAGTVVVLRGAAPAATSRLGRSADAPVSSRDGRWWGRWAGSWP